MRSLINPLVNNHKISNPNKGSITVEASIIFPIIFSVLLLVLYLVFYLYQYTYMQALANHSAIIGSSKWRYIHDNSMLSNDLISFDTHLYWRLYDAKKDRKEEIILNYATDKGEIYSLLRSNKGTKPLLNPKHHNTIYRTRIKYSNNFLSKGVTVSIEESYMIPTVIANSLNIGSLFTVKVQGEARIDEPAEVIRNIDLALDLLDKNPTARGIKKEISEKTKRIENKLMEFFDSR